MCQIEEQDALDSAVSSGSLQEAVSICTRHSTASPLVCTGSLSHVQGAHCHHYKDIATTILKLNSGS